MGFSVKYILNIIITQQITINANIALIKFSDSSKYSPPLVYLMGGNI